MSEMLAMISEKKDLLPWCSSSVSHAQPMQRGEAEPLLCCNSYLEVGLNHLLARQQHGSVLCYPAACCEGTALHVAWLHLFIPACLTCTSVSSYAFACLSHSAALRMSPSRMQPLLLL